MVSGDDVWYCSVVLQRAQVSSVHCNRLYTIGLYTVGCAGRYPLPPVPSAVRGAPGEQRGRCTSRISRHIYKNAALIIYRLRRGRSRGIQYTFAVSEHCKAPLHDHVELTPGGHRKHSLQRTSPGGTTRTAHYVSPLTLLPCALVLYAFERSAFDTLTGAAETQRITTPLQ